MEDRRELVKVIARIWRLHDSQEVLYKALMCRDISGRFRKVCSNAHISALLFKKDLKIIYEAFKCNLSDSDISSAVKSDNSHWDDLPKEHIVSLITGQQNELLNLYERVIVLLSEYTEMCALCNNHFTRLKKQSEVFSEKSDIKVESQLRV